MRIGIAQSIPILVIITAGILMFILYPSDKRQIRKVINRCEEAIQNEDIDGLMRNISYNYRDDYGNNYLLLKRRVQMVFDRFDDIKTEKVLKEIIIDGDNAEVLMDTSVKAIDDSDTIYVIGDEVYPENIKIYLEKTMHRWRIKGVKINDTFNNPVSFHRKEVIGHACRV